MFERFNEPARRTVFFARFEASRFGSPEITTEHLLLGFLRENAPFLSRLVSSSTAPDAIRSQIEAQCPRLEPTPSSADIPLNQAARRALAYAIEESLRLKHSHVGPQHLLLGLVREEKSPAAALLLEHGITLQKLRELPELPERPPPAPAVPAATAPAPVIAETCHDLTAAALENAFRPLIGRERDIEIIIQVLGRRSGNSPALIGETGVGKTAIIQGLAQRIVNHAVPQFLVDKRILALDPESFPAATLLRRKFPALLSEIPEQSNVILSIDGLFDAAGGPFAAVLSELLAALFSRRVQCIATGTPAGFREAVRIDPAVERLFRAVEITPPSEEDTIQILLAAKEPYEKYHGVTYDDAAVATAVAASVEFMPRRHLPEKALDLLDEAGARVKLRRENEPREIAECRRRIRAIEKQLESAIASHEFPKARALGEQEREEHEKLRLLQEERPEDASATVVNSLDIETLVSERTGLTLDAVRKRLEKK